MVTRERRGETNPAQAGPASTATLNRQMPDQRQLGAEVQGSLYAEVSRRLVQLHKECYGRGPTKARSFTSDNLLVCVLEGGYHRSERTLVEHGRADAVAEQRQAIQEVLHDRFVGTVEEVTGRRVKAFLSATDERTEMAAEIFVLEPEGDHRQPWWELGHSGQV
jgi:uncharacterized protein YbcI